MKSIIELMKALIVLSMVLIQWGIVYLNLNQWGIFQNFVEIQWYEEHPKQEEPMMIQDPYEPDLFT
tara:strand:- start:187 stop:384 length:198 start_codon:yes stop_codon:yes gene_type:complete